MSAGASYSLCRLDGSIVNCKIAHLYGWQGLKRVERDRADAGDIAIVAGIEDINIGETIADPERPLALKPITHRRADRGDDLLGQQLAVGRPRGRLRDLAQVG